MASNQGVYWPGWETVRLIDCGSFGAVYEIQREIRGRTEHAALKVISIPQNESEIRELRADGYDDESITQYFTDSLEKIEDEYAMMADLKGHSNVVYCDDIRTVQHDNGFGWDIYIKMELLTPLKSYLSGKVTDAQVIKLGMDICDALKLCEGLNIVHRDIKPENIFVSRNGNYKLGDFGIAKTMEGTTGGTKTGSYDYMAPEVYNNRPYHTQADICSLGLVMYWFLNNRTAPFLPQKGKKPTPSEKSIARDRRFSGEKIPAPSNGSTELQKIVMKACAFETKDRYQSAREMREDLMRLSGGYVSESTSDSKLIPNQDVHIYPDDRTTGSVFETTSFDDFDEKTVGPAFDPVPVADLDDLGETVGPDFRKRIDDRPDPETGIWKDPESTKKKLWLIIAAVCVIIALVVMIIPQEKAAENNLMSDIIVWPSGGGQYGLQPAFGSTILRYQIRSLKILNSLDNVPENAWDVSENKDGSVKAWVIPNGDFYDLYIAGEGGVTAPKDCTDLFAGYAFEEIDFNNSFYTHNTEKTDFMFAVCSRLQNLDLSGFETNNVVSMELMFAGCYSLTSVDVSNFNTKNVQNMGGMFAWCNSLTELDVQGFDTANVRRMNAMFMDCRGLFLWNDAGGYYEPTTLDVSNFDMSNVTYWEDFVSIEDKPIYIDGQPWENLFEQGTQSEGENPIQGTENNNVLMSDHVNLVYDNTGNHETQPVFGSKIMRNQIKYIHILDSTENMPEEAWDVSEKQDKSVWAWVSSNDDLYDLYIAGDGGVVAPEDCSMMFALYYNLEEIQFNNSFFTQNVKSADKMFYYCRNLSELDLRCFETKNIVSMHQMFCGCTSLASLDVSSFNTEKVQDMAGMFALCWNLKELNVRKFDTSNVANMQGMFSYCKELGTLDVTAFDTSNVTDMSMMFQECQKLYSWNEAGYYELSAIDVSNFDISNVTYWEDFVSIEDKPIYIDGQPWENLFEQYM